MDATAIRAAALRLHQDIAADETDKAAAKVRFETEAAARAHRQVV